MPSTGVSTRDLEFTDTNQDIYVKVTSVPTTLPSGKSLFFSVTSEQPVDMFVSSSGYPSTKLTSTPKFKCNFSFKAVSDATIASTNRKFVEFTNFGSCNITDTYFVSFTTRASVANSTHPVSFTFTYGYRGTY